MNGPHYWLVIFATILTTCAAFYALATVGEPQSAWLVCDMLGLDVCPKVK